jgi:hypothetical protein
MKIAFVLSCFAALAASAHAQFIAGFEAPATAASPTGTPLGAPWYNPVVAPSIDHDAYTYAGNSLGFVDNPVGGSQFIGGVSGGGSTFPRAQVNIDFSAGTWTLGYDMAALWSGSGSSSQNLGSFSLQHNTVPAGQFKQFIALNNFVDLTNPAGGWKVEFNIFDAAGTAINNASPGGAWSGLQLNHWYRQQVTVDLASNRILSIALLDLHTLSSSAVTPSDWYLTGGATSTLALPNGVRFFVGGAAGNTMGWDNLYIVPAPGALAVLGVGLAFGSRRRRA